jgi:hypothetical protein
MPSAASQVFDLPELLELVLRNLDPRELFAVERVCRSFHNALHGSPTLRRAMYLAPAHDKHPDAPSVLDLNVLIRRSGTDGLPSIPSLFRMDSPYSRAGSLHIMVDCDSAANLQAFSLPMANKGFILQLSGSKTIQQARLQQAPCLVRPSWKKMRLACSSIPICFSTRYGFMGKSEYRTHGGGTLGNVMDWLETLTLDAPRPEPEPESEMPPPNYTSTPEFPSLIELHRKQSSRARSLGLELIKPVRAVGASRRKANPHVGKAGQKTEEDLPKFTASSSLPKYKRTRSGKLFGMDQDTRTVDP